MVCGGLQDNGNWCGTEPTALSEGIRKNDWYTVSAATASSPCRIMKKPWLVYSDVQGGVISVTDTRTGSARRRSRRIRTASARSATRWRTTSIASTGTRRSRSSPTARPCTSAATSCSSRPTTDSRGTSISPDLTTNDKSKQKSSGGPIVVDNTAAEFHCTISRSRRRRSTRTSSGSAPTMATCR